MNYVIPDRPLALDPAHAANHADTADLFALLTTTREINVKVAPYSAQGDLTVDDTPSIQAALDAVKAAGGGAIRIPPGDYDIPGGLAWSGGASIKITGAGPNATRLHTSPSAAPYTAIAVTGSNRVIIEDLTFVSDFDPGDTVSTYEAVRLDGTAWASLRHVHMTTGKARRLTTGIMINSAGYTDIDDCDLRAYVNCVAAYGTAAKATRNISVRFSQLYLTTTGAPNAASIWCDGNVATIRVAGVVFNGGDRSWLWSDFTGTGRHPSFGFLWDAEMNNNSVAAMQLDAGNQLWATGCWLSTNKGKTGDQPAGLTAGPGYLGQSYFTQCTWQGFAKDSVRLSAGNGFGFTNCVFGDMNVGKAAVNAYDMLNIEGKTRNVSVVGCHFNTDTYYMFGATKPRSAIHIGPDVTGVALAANLTATSGYGTSALLDEATGRIPLPAPPGYTDLLFSDQFHGSVLDASKWVTYLGAEGNRWDNRGTLPSPYSGENMPGAADMAMYAPAQVTVNNGATLTAERSASPAATYPWLSGIITTEGKFSTPTDRPWYAQIRAKMPDCSKGMWPAIWFLRGTPGSPDNELDAHEGGWKGFNPVNNYMHCGFFAPEGERQAVKSAGADLSADFHVYGVEFIPGTAIRVYLDGTKVYEVLASQGVTITAEPYQLMLQLQVAAPSTSGWHTEVDDSTPTSHMLIDEAQVWA